MKKNLTKALVFVLGTGVAGSVFAGGVSTSYLRISDFLFVNTSDGEAIEVGIDIALVPNVNETAGDITVGGSFFPSASVSDQKVPDGTGFDLPNQCLGNGAACGAYVENSFAYTPNGTDPGTFRTVGDLQQTGSSIGFPGLVTDGADSQTMTDLSLGPQGSLSGQNNIEVSAVFLALETVEVRLDYSADAFLRAFLSDDLVGTVANSDIIWTVEISGLGVDFTHAPDELNEGVSAFAVDGFREDTYSVSGETYGDDASRTFTLLAGELYTFNITQSTEADLTIVPVPGVLSLMGLGLLGLGVARRRRVVNA